MFKKLSIFFNKKSKKIISNYFSNDCNHFKRLIFNTLTIFFFISIVLTMGFTRIYPLNHLLKITFLITNILIISYVLLYAEIKIDKFLILIIFSFLWFFMIALLNKSISGEQSLLFNTLNMIPLYLMSAYSPKFRKIFYKGIIFGLLLYTFAFTIYYLPYLIRLGFDARLGDFFGNQNDIAATLLIAITIFTYFSLNGKYIYILPTILAFINLLSTGSRAGLLNAIIITLFLFISLFRKRNKYVFWGGIALIITGLVLIQIIPAFELIKKRLNSMLAVLLGGNASADSSTAQRLGVIFDAFILFFLSPLWGNSVFLNQFSTDMMVAHNAFLEIASRQGIISLMLFIAIFVYPLIKVIKSKLKHRILFAAIIIGSLLFHLTLTSLPFKEQYLILVLVMSLLPQQHYALNPRKEYLKIKLKRYIVFIEEKLHKNNSIDFNIISNKKNVVAISNYNNNLLFINQPHLAERIVELSIDHNFIFRKSDFLDLDDKFFIIKGFDTNNVSHLILLNYLKSHSNYKTIVVARKIDFDVEILSPSFYKILGSSILRTYHLLAEPLPAKPLKMKSEKIISIKNDNKEQVKQLEIVDKIFLCIFSLLSIISFYYGAKDIILWQKILLILFSSIYYFQVINSIFSDRNISNIKNLLLSILFVPIIPCSIILIGSLLLPNILSLEGLTLYFVIFVFFTNTIAIIIRYYLNKLH